jgi:hypothetical protein
LRIYFQNINGIIYNNRTEKTHKIAESLLQKGVDILGLAETNIDWRHPISNDVRQAFTHRFKNVHFTNSSSHHDLQPNRSIDLRPRPFQPGGTATVVTGRYVGRVQTSSSTALGLFSSVSLQGCKGTTLTIITAYRGPQRAGDLSAGPTMAYRQQHNILRLQNIDNPDPRNQLLLDLRAFIRPLVQQGHAIIIILDANENINSRHSRLEAFRQDLDFVDLHTYRHGYADEPETHQHNTSGQRIDYILATPSVAACLLQAGIEAYSCNEYSSDHRGLFIDIDAEALLQGHIAELDNANGRGISSSSPKTIAKYKQLVLTIL